MSVQEATIPSENIDDCKSSVELLPVKSIEQTSIGSSYIVEFPVNSENILPLSGGSVVSIDAAGIDFMTSSKVNSSILSIINKNLLSSDIPNSFNEYSRIRTLINKTLFEISSKNYKVISGEIKQFKQPSLYIAYSESGNSFFRNICEFRFIDIGVIKDINQIVSSKWPKFIGQSGLLLSNQQRTTVDDVLDIFPISNISSDVLNQTDDENPFFSGFYTLSDEKIFLKIPSFSPSIADEGRLSFSFIYKTYTSSIEISKFQKAPEATIDSQLEIELPASDSVNIVLTSNSDISKVFLSVISETKPVNSSDLKTFNTAQYENEIFTIPVLTKPLLSYGVGQANIDDISKVYSLLNSNTDIKNYFKSGQTFSEDSGLAFFDSRNTNISSENLIGESNRADIVLFDYNDYEFSSQKNKRVYYRFQSNSAFRILNSVRSRIYNFKTPDTWLESTLEKKQIDSSYMYTATFSCSNFPFFEQESRTDFSKKFPNGIKYAVYVSDIVGQISRVGTIRFIEATPTLLSISNDGMNGNFLTTTSLSTISFSGDYLSNTKTVIFRSDSNSYSFSNLLKTKNNLNIDSASSIIPMLGKYEIILLSYNGEEYRTKKFLHVVNSVGDTLPTSIYEEEELAEDDFSALDGKTIKPIPLSETENSLPKISIKSKRALFNKLENLYCYLASEESSDLNLFSSSNKIIKVNDKYILADFEYELNSQDNDFYTSDSSGKFATIIFPTSRFISRNYQALLNKNLYFVFSKTKIQDTNTGSLSFLKIGEKSKHTNSNISCYNPGWIYDIIIDGRGTSKVYSSEEKNILDKYFPNITNSYPLNVYQKAKNFVIVSSVYLNRKTRISVFIDGIEYSKKIKTIIRSPSHPDRIFIVMSNIESTKSNILNTYIKVYDSEFYCEFDSNNTYAKYSLVMSKDDYNLSVNSLTNDLLLENFYKNSEGSFITYPQQQNLLSCYQITVKPNFSGIIYNDIILQNTYSDYLNNLEKNIIVKQGTSLINVPSLTNDFSNEVLLFFKLDIQNPYSLSFNLPYISAVYKNNSNLNILSLEDLSLNEGDEYIVELLNVANDNFDLLLDGIKLNKIKESENRFKFLVTKELSGKTFSESNALKLCVSTSNVERNNWIKIFGPKYVDNIGEESDGRIFGDFRFKIPDITNMRINLPEISFLNFPIENLYPYAKSVCELSFHSTNDLRIALKGFQSLLTPINIIFAIIDVICSLMNPKRVAKAVIRLFQSLYDLVVMLPQVSVPVMYTNLIIHFLYVLDCVNEKLTLLIRSINNTIDSIISIKNNNGSLNSLRSLEENLSQLGLSINVELDVLQPITSIIAIFIELLQMIFRFPCTIDQGSDQPDCGIDGTMMAGIITSIMAPDLKVITNKLIPVAQTYSTSSIGETTDSNIIEPTENLICGDSSQYENNYSSYLVDEDSLRATNSDLDFLNTFGPTFTKSKKSKDKYIKFEFNERSKSSSLKTKYIDPNQTVDSKLMFFNLEGNYLKTAKFGNLYSPIDNYLFLDINLEKKNANVKPLSLELKIPVYTTDELTGFSTQTGTESVYRTFENIPSLSIIDDELNLYFIKEDGIEFDNDGYVKSITAKIMNQPAGIKLKFSKEEEEVDTDDDSILDDTIDVFDFPQFYIFDMRYAGENISQFCTQSSINNFALNQNDSDDILNILNRFKDCFEIFKNKTLQKTQSINDSIISGNITKELKFEENFLSDAIYDIRNCSNESLNDMCKYTVSSLNTSFKIEEDKTAEDNEIFVTQDLPSDISENFSETNTVITGASEYASGIGTFAQISVNKQAEISIILRDAYDSIIYGDYSNSINVEKIFDSTNAAVISNITYDNGIHKCYINTTSIGQVKIRANVCSRQIQSLTYNELAYLSENSVSATNCAVKSGPSNTESNIIGALTKIDRVLTLQFISNQSGNTSLKSSNTHEESYNNIPQELGTKLVN